MRNEKSNTILGLIANISIAIVILYTFVLQLFFQNSTLLLLFTILSIISSVLRNNKINIGGIYFTFILVTSITSILASSFSVWRLNSYTLIRTFAFYIAVINCMRTPGGFKYIKTAAIASGLMLSIMLYGNGRSIEGARNSASELMNENVVAATILTSIIFALYEVTNCKSAFLKKIIIILIALMCFACLLTGTRKAFISITLLIILYIVFVIMQNKSIGKTNSGRNVFLAIIGLIATAFFIRYAMENSIVGERMRGFGYQGDKNRQEYYELAFQIFKGNWLFGKGWGGFARTVGMYSHSTYCELIANTGIIGTFVFIYQYVSIFILARDRIKEKDENNKNILKIAAISIIVVLVMGLGCAVFYEINLTLCIAVAVSLLQNKKEAESKHENTVLFS